MQKKKGTNKKSNAKGGQTLGTAVNLLFGVLASLVGILGLHFQSYVQFWSGFLLMHALE